MRIFWGIVAIVMFSVMVFGMGYVAENASVRSQQVQMQENQLEAQKSFEVQAVENIKDVAVAGFASNVAIAVSGDASQASMTKSFAWSIWGMVGVIAMTIILVVVIDSRKKSNSDSGHYIDSSVWQDHDHSVK